MIISRIAPPSPRQWPGAVRVLATAAVGCTLIALRFGRQLYWLPPYLVLLALPLARRLMGRRNVSRRAA